MIDESMDKEAMKQPPKPDEFRSKKTWQRLIIMIGGVTVNAILAIIIYIIMLWHWGEQYLPNENVTNGIAVDSLAMECGLQNGDQILMVDDVVIEDFFDIVPTILLEKAETILVKRDGQNKTLAVPDDFIKKLIDSERSSIIVPRLPMIVDSIPPSSINLNAGIQKGDVLIALDSNHIEFRDEFQSLSENYLNREVDATFLRGTDTIFTKILINDEGMMEVFLMTDLNVLFGTSTKEYTFLQAIPAGTKKAFTTIGDYFKQMKLIFSKNVRGYENVGGFISIGKIFPGTWDWYAFWKLTAFLSIMLAILNILPIPALDGGHVMFLIIEMIIGRKLPDKTMEIAQYIGFFLLMALLLLANGNDVIKLFG
jgi:regulator of sigma E protease